MKLEWPCKSEISQRFGENALPLYKQLDMLGHNGLDLTPGFLAPINAAAKGIVVVSKMDEATVADPNKGYGNYVVLKHQDGNYVWETLYAHFYQRDVEVGDEVETGERLGLCGSTGYSTGPHLHFALGPIPFDINNGYKGWIDPLPYLIMKIEFVHKAGTGEYGVLITTPAGSQYIAFTTEAYAREMGKSLKLDMFSGDNIDYSRAKDITL